MTSSNNTNVQDALEEACALVAGACSQLAERTDYAASSAVLRAQEVLALLRECGAGGPQMVLLRGTPVESLQAAAAALDQIVERERPPLLGSARTELGAVLDTLQRSELTHPDGGAQQW